MTDRLPADPKRRQTPPMQQKRQGSAEQTHRAANQPNRNNAAGNHPAVQRGNVPAQCKAPPVSPQGVKRPAPNGSHAQAKRAPAPGQKPAAQTNRQVPAKRPQNVKPVPQKQVQGRPVPQKGAPQRPVSQKPAVKKTNAPKDKIPVRPFLLMAAFLALAGVIIFFAFFMADEAALIKKKVTVEVGTTASFDMFMEGQPKYPQYLSTNLDFTTVDYNTPQTVFFSITLYGIDHDCELVVADTVPPTGEPVTQNLFSVDPIPEASECVTNIQDKTPVTVTWAEVPDYSAGGEFAASAKLTDAGGNETIVLVPLSVIRDSEAPVITGTRDLSIVVGETISYRTGVELIDNFDKNPKLDIDTSGVKLDKAGDYQATYKATDFSGNTSEVTIKVKIKAKPKGYVEPDVVYAQAKDILAKIVTPEMNDMEKALQIVWWVRQNIRFNLRIKPKSWTEAAYNAFRERRGNCLSSASCVKAMLDVSGIENMFVTRWPYKVAKHYWNYVKIDGQWYHCDATWRQNYDSYFFMYTTKELLSFWHDGWNGFEFNQLKYPESATVSVQKKIDYKNHKIKS